MDSEAQGLFVFKARQPAHSTAMKLWRNAEGGSEDEQAGVSVDRNRRERGFTLEAVYFTVVAVGLYFVSDWILKRSDIAAKRRFEHRTLTFFAILLTLALCSFGLIRSLSSG